MLSIQSISKSYKKQQVLQNVSFDAAPGECIGLLGPNGCGKSTLLHILACIDNYQEGEYTIDGTLVKNLSEKQYAKIRNEKIGMVMQDFALVEDFTALENVMIPLNFSKQKIKNKKEKALAALKSVGIGELAKKPCNKLSGGQKQRVAIARAIVNEPSMILADEPTGALDYQTGKAILGLLQDMCRQKGMTVVVITHNSALTPMADRVIRIKNGKVAQMTLNDHPTPVEEIEW